VWADSLYFPTICLPGGIAALSDNLQIQQLTGAVGIKLAAFSATLPIIARYPDAK
jgi:hypothetical protein